MPSVLHKAIKDAVRDPGYKSKVIHVSTVLEATADVAAQGDDLYRAVHRLFTALPTRLVRGSILLIRTEDVHDGVQLAWDAREEPRGSYAMGQGLYAAYDENEPIALALRELERSCEMRAGHVRTSFEKVANSSSFPRAPYLHRRIVAHLPIDPRLARQRAAEASRAAAPPEVTLAPPAPRRRDDLRLAPPAARVWARTR